MWFIGVYYVVVRVYKFLLNIYCSIKKNVRKELRMIYLVILFYKKYGSCICVLI